MFHDSYNNQVLTNNGLVHTSLHKIKIKLSNLLNKYSKN